MKKIAALFFAMSYAANYAQEEPVKTDTIQEIVLVGYGAKSKGTISGSVSQIKANEILKTPSQSAMQSIQGKVAGLTIIASDNPGQNPEVLLRGMSSVLGGRSPLYVIDGVETTSLNNISSNDIETIDVLKDASSLAIYGNKGANGVILVTTKKGKGKISVNYNGFMSVRTVLNRVEMANSYEFAYFNNVAIGNASFFNFNQPYNTDWFKEITQKGVQSNHAVNISGSSENISYSFGANHFIDEGILRGSRFERTAINNKNEFKLFNKLLTITQFANLSLVNGTPKPLSAFTNAYLQAPIMPVYYENGQFAQPFVNSLGLNDRDGIRYNTVANPVAQLFFDNSQNRNTTLTGAISAELKILKNLTATSRFGATMDWGKGYSYTPTRDIWLANNPNATVENYNPSDPINVLEQRRSEAYSWNWDNFLTYKFKFSDHNFITTAGTSRTTTRNSNFLNAKRRNVPTQPNYWSLNLSTDNTAIAPGDVVSGGQSTPQVFVSYFGRAEYDYQQKYLLNFSLRRDQVSDFQGANKGGNFIGTSVGWVISKENFFNIDAFNLLKLRTGYGEIGNAGSSNNVNNYLFFPGSNYSFGGVINPGSIGIRVDDNLTWETTKEINLGLDARMFKNRLTFNLDWYRKLTDDVVLSVDYPAVLVPQTVLSNAGSVLNQGIEMNLGWADNIGVNWKYSASTQLSYNKNELKESYNPLFSNMIGGSTNNGRTTKQVQVGQALGSFYVFEVLGYDSDGKFVLSDKRKFVGSYLPKYTFNLNLSVGYKYWNLSTQLFGVSGNKVYNGLKAQRLQSLNVAKDVLNNIWTPTNANPSNPLPSQETPQPSDYFIEDGSFLRINNITLSYDVPQFSKFFKSIQVYATAVNPFIFTKYSGFSPEIIGSPLGNAGIELDAYPTNSIYTIGVNINL